MKVLRKNKSFVAPPQDPDLCRNNAAHLSQQGYEEIRFYVAQVMEKIYKIRELKEMERDTILESNKYMFYL